jgi:D-cysteine desulfhydrase
MSFPLFYLFSNYLLGRFCTEVILLDPVYTGKAFAGRLDLIEKGNLGSNEPIILLHTGGLPALFAFDS